MRLYLKQKVFSWKDKSTVKDERGEDRYYVEGKVISLGKKLTVFDAGLNEVAFIRQQVLTFMPKFIVEIGGEEVAVIKKKFTLFKPSYVVEGLDWEITGDLWSHDYSVVERGKVVATIHKKWMSWGDTFELWIEDGKDEVAALAVILAIDAVMDAQAAAAASSSNG